MCHVIFTTLAATAIGAASVLAGAVTPAKAQALSPSEMSVLLQTAGYTAGYARQDTYSYHRAVPHRRVVHRRAVPYEPGVTGAIGGPGVPYYEPGVTGAIGVAPALTADPNFQWPACLQGPPVCTAAGYPNLRWFRETQGVGY
ncbi:hypothetical protein [Microvirga sp. 2TAF3]|uniref:hypothetical protein n=1 Tax=Microvirga sp. 2TAF3 TaxID=3233014 RepID=UPI003F94A633